MNKAFSTCIIIVLFVTFCNCSVQKKTAWLDSYQWFPFTWHSAKISGKNFDKAAISVPAKANNLSASFTLQFDLGSDATSIYGNTLSSYYTTEEFDNFIIKSAKYTSDAGHTSYDTKGIQLSLAGFIVGNLLLKDKYGDSILKDSLYTNSPKHLGTLGADAFKDKILVIDYPKQRMCVLDELDDLFKKRTTFVETRYQKGRLHIPLRVNNKTYWFLFDTGASLFPINTDKDTWSQLVGNLTPQDTIEANSWGEKVKFYGSPVKENVYLGKQKLKGGYAWYNENKRLMEFNKAANIDGLTGNAYFLNEIIVLDFKNNKFGIMDK